MGTEDTDWRWESNNTTFENLNTTWEDADGILLTETWTPSTSENWIIMSNAELRGTATSSRQAARLSRNDETTIYDASDSRNYGSNNGKTWMSLRVLTLSASEEKFEIQARDAYSTTVNGRRPRFFAVRSAIFDQVVEIADDTFTSVSMADTWEEKLDVAYTPNQSEDLLILGHISFNPSSGLAHGQTRIHENETTDFMNHSNIPNNVTDVISISAADIVSVTSVYNADMDIQGAVITEQTFGNARVVLISLTSISTAPIITSLVPTSGSEGISVTIAGSNFGATQEASTVAFNGTAVTSYTSWSDTEVVVEVPVGATTGDVVITVNSINSNGSAFSVYPKITDLSPSSGSISDTVTITGLNFEAARGSNTVTFNGVEASSYDSWSATEVVVTVPSSTTGNVILTTSVGASTGMTFSYTPTITSLSPTSGSLSRSVTITGTNFGGTQGSSYVSFGSTQAATSNYLVWGTDSIVVQVPSGITKGDHVVTVTTSIGTSNSQTFRVTAGTSMEGAMPAPIIKTVAPTSVDLSQLVTTRFTIVGTNFDIENGVRVQCYLTGVGWLDAQLLSATATSLTVKLADATLARVGDYYMIVTNLQGGNQDALEKSFTVVDATAPAEETVEEEKETTAPGTIDNAAVTLLTERFDFLNSQVIDLLRFFGRFLSASDTTDVLESSYRYEIDFQSPDPSLTVGESQSLIVFVKNVGTATWYGDGAYPVHLGTSNPLDRTSIFVADSWFGDNNRSAVLQEESVAPNGLGTFVVSFEAPNILGTHLESFKLVAENFVWLSGPEINWAITVAR